MIDGVVVEEVASREILLEILGLDNLPDTFFDGSKLEAEFQFGEKVLEKEIENKLVGILNARGQVPNSEGLPKFECHAFQQVMTFEGGILDVIVFDRMCGLEDAGAPVSCISPFLYTTHLAYF